MCTRLVLLVDEHGYQARKVAGIACSTACLPQKNLSETMV